MRSWGTGSGREFTFHLVPLCTACFLKCVYVLILHYKS